MKLAFALILVLAAPVSAEDTHPWPLSQRHTADVISTWLVAGQLGADVTHALRSDDRHAALRCLGLRTLITVGSAETVKMLVHRARPDGSDRQSFYSEHTALAVSSAGWRWQIGIPIAIGAGYLRIAADKHYLTDIAVGAAAGILVRKVCR